MTTRMAASALALGGMLTSFSSSAAIADYGTYFQDTDTGLYWLKLDATQDRSYNDISSKLGYQEEFEGWRYASIEELETLVGNYGIPSPGNTCAIGTYCGSLDATYDEQVEDLIRLFGDTWDDYLDATNDTKDAAPDGTAKARGLIGEPYPWASYERIAMATIQDREWVDRATGDPINDWPDAIWTEGGVAGPTEDGAALSFGSFLVRDTDPSLPLPPDYFPPDPADSLTPIIFDDLAPEEINLTVDCRVDPWGPGPCGWTNEGYVGYVPDVLFPPIPDFSLALTPDFDAQARPWVRMLSYEIDEELTVIDSPVWAFLPTVAANIDTNPVIPGTTVTAPLSGYCPNCSYTVDNVQLEFISENAGIDFDPWSAANEIRPRDSYLVTIEIKTTSVADGDAYDFDATLIDPATLRVGPGMAEIAALPLASDRDGDGDTDMTFAFNVADTGITCLDTSIMIAGQTTSGAPFAGRDTIAPTDCTETVAADVDPYNDPNVLRPNDDYNVSFAFFGMRTTDGDATDFSPDREDLATGLNRSSVAIGPAGTPLTGPFVEGLIDADSHADLTGSFNVFDAGIACGDTELQVTGEMVSGLPIEARIAIETEDCDTGCHP